MIAGLEFTYNKIDVHPDDFALGEGVQKLQ